MDNTYSRQINRRTGFMPGCSLSSSSPENVAKTISYLQGHYPDLSVIQKCCGKPTMALGQEETFAHRYKNVIQDVKACEIDQLVVACQNCLSTLKNNSEFTTVSLWELIPLIGLPDNLRNKGKDSDVVFSIHDSCSSRQETNLHEGIRLILDQLGYKYIDPQYSRQNTRCCGSGGMVVTANPDLAKRVMERRVNEFTTDYIVVYCASCRSSMLTGGGQAWHILDLIFGPVVYKNSNPPQNVLATPIKAWLNRYTSKKVINRVMNIQNYAYGITPLRFSTFVFVSLITMLPGAVIYAFMAGEIAMNGVSAKLMLQLAVAGIILFGVSLIPRYIARKRNITL